MELFTRKKIRLSKNLGEKLRLQRKRKNVDLSDAEAETKIAMKYLAAIEHSEYDKLPADVYVYGFLERYAIYLGLNKDVILGMYRDEKKIFNSVKNIKKHTDQKNANLIKPKPNEKWLKTSRFIVTPELVIGFFVAVVVIGLLGYIWFQVKSFAAAPPLELRNAEAEIVVSTNKIVVSGTTDAQASLDINNQSIAINTDGSFSQEVQLNKGINTIEIVAKNKANKETKKTIQILSK